MIYLDNSATTRVFDESANVALYSMTNGFFNPASSYRAAVEVERAVEAARGRLLSAMGVNGEIVYTSGGTESNNMALLGAAALLRKNVHWRLITTSIEHPSVHEVFLALERQGFEVIRLGSDKTGCVSLRDLEGAVNERTALVSAMHVNNEVGAVNDLDALYRIVKRASPNALVHSDGVQAFCKLPFVPVSADLYSISGHKFHAPKGVGALMIRKGARIGSGQMGGGQERGMRSGTMNAAGILAMDASMTKMRENHDAIYEHLRRCKVRLARQLLTLPDVFVNGPEPEDGAPHILSVSFAGVRGEVMLHALDERGICVSTGSACSAKKKGKNRILDAMGVAPALMEGNIRFSLCCLNTLEEMDRTCNVVAELLPGLRRFKER